VSLEKSQEIRASVRPLSINIYVPNCIGEELSKLLAYVGTAKVELKDGYLMIESDDIRGLFIHKQFKLSTGRLVDDYVTILEAEDDGKLFVITNTDADEEGVWLMDAAEAADFICSFLEISTSDLKELLTRAQALEVLPTLAKWMDGR